MQAIMGVVERHGLSAWFDVEVTVYDDGDSYREYRSIVTDAAQGQANRFMGTR